MDVITLGPLALPVEPVVLLLAMVAAVTISRLRARGEQRAAEDWVWLGFVGSVFLARTAYVLQYLPDYLENPISILDIRDGGFSSSAGVIFAIGFAGLVAWRRSAVKPRLVGATVAGMVVWFLSGLTFQAVGPSNTRLPAITMFDMQANPKALHAYLGKPLVVNLWATWCPPCRREMPVLEAAQQDYPDITFVFANQGETIEAVRAYLTDEQLNLHEVLTDPASTLSQLTKSRGLPTTLFFDEEGNLIARRMGELSKATLKQRVAELQALGN